MDTVSILLRNGAEHILSQRNDLHSIKTISVKYKSSTTKTNQALEQDELKKYSQISIKLKIVKISLWNWNLVISKCEILKETKKNISNMKITAEIFVWR